MQACYPYTRAFSTFRAFVIPSPGRPIGCPSELPRHPPIRRRRVGAEIAGLDAGSEVMRELRMDRTDRRQRTLDAFGYHQPRPLGRAARLAVLAVSPNRCTELLADEVHFRLQLCCTPEIVEAFSLFQLIAQLVQALLVGTLGFRV